MPKLITFSYFPVQENNSVDEKNDEQIDIYHQLSDTVRNILSSDSSIRRKEEKNLAFLVEAIKQLDPQNWKATVQDLKERIICKLNNNPMQASVEVSWLIHQVITGLYKKSLSMCAINAENQRDHERSNLYSQTLSLVQINEEMARNIHAAGKPVTFKIIRNEFVPDWFSMVQNGKINSIARG